jgi:hypothetical protein
MTLLRDPVQPPRVDAVLAIIRKRHRRDLAQVSCMLLRLRIHRCMESLHLPLRCRRIISPPELLEFRAAAKRRGRITPFPLA